MTRVHAERIKGRNSRDIAHILGTPGRAEMIHRDDMALTGAIGAGRAPSAQKA